MTSGGQFTNAPGATATLTRFTNTSSGRMTLSGSAFVSDFTSDGQLSVPTEPPSRFLLPNRPGRRKHKPRSPAAHDFSQWPNSRTARALLVNNGHISIGATNVNFGSLAKGSGVYGAVNVTDGGRFSPGNSPGSVTTGSTTWNSGGSYVVEIADALAGGGHRLG